MGDISLEDVRKRMNQNYDCIKKMEEIIPLQDTDQEKLEVITLIGKMYAEYVTGVYSSDILERQIIEIGSKLECHPIKKPINNKVLIVMSQAAITGGHSVLVQNWIIWDDENEYHIVFTNMEETNLPKFIEEAVKTSGGQITYLFGDYMEKAQKLLAISKDFQRIILFTHMEDVVPVLAYSHRQWEIPVYFYNHADFRFSYGYSIADVVLNLFSFDVDKSIRYRGVSEKDCIHFEFPGYGQIEKKKEILDRRSVRSQVFQKYNIEENEKLIVSMGADFKYENIIGYEFDSFVKEVLKQSSVEATFLIIGADRKREKWIDLEKRTYGKGRALGILPRDEAEKIITAADVYISSFPMVAYGQSDAQLADIPCLCLNIYGRGFVENDIRFADTIPELIRKTIDILEGDGNEYIVPKTSKEYLEQKWKSQLRKIYDNVTEHKLHVFHPQRYLEKQEYVNCQLMQKKAAQELCLYIENSHLNDRIKEKIFALDRMYDMGIIYCYANDMKIKSLNMEKLSDKHLRLYLTAIRWLELKQSGKKIGEYCWRLGYHKTAIYGMSYMGKCLLNDLADDVVKVLYGIDRNAENIYAEIPVYKPSDRLEKVDLIFNTTTIDNADILKTINIDDADKVKIVNLNEVLEGI